MPATPRDALKEAIALKRKKDYDRAWDLLSSLEGALSENGFFWSNYAHLALLTKRWEEGIDFARRALLLRPDDPFSLSIHAQLLEGLGRHGDALDQYRLRLEKEFNLFDFRRMIDLAVKAEDLEPAESIFAQWQASRGDDPGLAQAMADGYRRLEKRDKALKLYNKVAALDPGNTFARSQALSMKLDQAPAGQGIRELSMMLKLKENRENTHLMALLARQHKQQGHLDKAAELFKRILEIKPDNLYYRQQLGFVLTKLDEDAAAIALLKPCAEAAPQNPYVMRSLLAALKRQGRKEEALRFMESLIARQPEPGRLYGLKKDIEKWP